MSKKSKKMGTDGGSDLGLENPFAKLDIGGLPQAEMKSAEPSPKVAPPKTKNRGRVDVMRKRSAGGAGWVTIASGFVGISLEEKNDLKKQIQKRCGTGGAVKNGTIEIQGDKREEVKAALEKVRFRVVYVGG